VNLVYHLKLLLHFEGGPRIDIPHFLRMSLNKMVRGVKSTYKKLENSLYHHGLMKLMVVHALIKQGRSWKQLLQQNFSQDGVSKSVEEHETEACSEESGRKLKDRESREKKTKSKGASISPSSSKLVDRLDKGKSVMTEDPTTSKKERSSQSKEPSPASIPKI
jgi:hypothetical protein